MFVQCYVYIRTNSLKVKMKLSTILVLKISLEICILNIFNMNEMQQPQKDIWFKGKNWKIKHINGIKYMF